MKAPLRRAFFLVQFDFRYNNRLVNGANDFERALDGLLPSKGDKNGSR